MKAKHTPGPWAVMPEECDKSYVRIRGMVLGGRYKVANVLTPVYEGVHAREAEETRANARLIAAAPELLEALQAVLRSFPTDRDMRDAGWERAEIDLACSDYEAARAAISKALPNAAAKEAGK